MSTGSGLPFFFFLADSFIELFTSTYLFWFKIDAHNVVLLSKMELPFNSLTGNSVSEELELTYPEDVIEGSARASVSVLGKTECLMVK